MFKRQTKANPINASSCCEEIRLEETGDTGDTNKTRVDWLLWFSAVLIVVGYFLLLFFSARFAEYPLGVVNEAIFQLMNTMWWSVLLAAVFVGVLGRIPRDFVIFVLGSGGTWNGLFRATLAGLLLDMCSHGILMFGMQLYQRGASLGQVMAFLIASPWNSLSLTIILISLIGLPWTLAIVGLSLLIALISGRIFDVLSERGVLPAQVDNHSFATEFQFWPMAVQQLRQVKFTPALCMKIVWEGISGSRMVLRWLLFGVVVAAVIRGLVEAGTYQSLFGPTLAGLGLTLLAATIIEVCSEGSSPISADLMNRAGAPGNSFAFLMAGVSTDYTEIMSIKDTTQSWKIALFLPLVTLPQIFVISYLLNNFT